MVSTDDYTLMRPLFFDFSNDEEALRQDTEYMFGHNLLICPVYQSILPAQTASLRVYLPQNKSGWYDFWTGELAGETYEELTYEGYGAGGLSLFSQ